MIGIVEASGLRGLGGAGFRSGQKWKLVRQDAGPRLMAINADEGEPGTFKDRYYLETDPHRFLEGMLIAAWAVEADEVYIYLRDEYPQIRAPPGRRDRPARSARGWPGRPRSTCAAGRGAYICGEETAMLESIEGQARLPPAEAALPDAGRPVRPADPDPQRRDASTGSATIVERGPDWLTGQGRNGRQGLRSFSVSGRVKEPGVKLAAGGDHRPGADRRVLRRDGRGAHVQGLPARAGPRAGILPGHLGDVPLDFGTLEPYGCFIGSAAVVVLSDRDDIRAVALNLMRFFEDESCGQCTPCRCGTEKAVAADGASPPGTSRC